MKFETFGQNPDEEKETSKGQEPFLSPESEEPKESLFEKISKGFQYVKEKCTSLINFEGERDKIDQSVEIEKTEVETAHKEFNPKFSEIKERAATLQNEIGDELPYLEKVDKEGSAFERLKSRSEASADEEVKNERWVEQRIKTLEVQEAITNALPPDQIEKLLQENIPDFHPQYRKMQRVVERYKQSFESVEKYKDQYATEPARLFEDLFKAKPDGIVDVKYTNTSIIIDCGKDDYARAWSGEKFSEMTNDEKLSVHSEGSATILSHIPKELLGKVVIVNRDAAEKFKQELGNVDGHEQQHVLNNLYSQEPKKHNYPSVSFNEIKASSLEQQSDLILSRMRHERQYPDNHKMSDELLAHYKGHEIKTEDEMGKKIIANLVISYRDRFYKGVIGYETRKLKELGVDEVTINECTTEIFQNESWRNMRKAGNVLLKIEQAGFTKDQAINLVQLEPIDKWSKVADALSKRGRRGKEDLGGMPTPSERE